MGNLCLSNSITDIKTDPLVCSAKTEIPKQALNFRNTHTFMLVAQQCYQQSPLSPYASGNKIGSL
jgi:hypothetical protein